MSLQRTIALWIAIVSSGTGALVGVVGVVGVVSAERQSLLQDTNPTPTIRSAPIFDNLKPTMYPYPNDEIYHNLPLGPGEELEPSGKAKEDMGFIEDQVRATQPSDGQFGISAHLADSECYADTEFVRCCIFSFMCSLGSASWEPPLIKRDFSCDDDCGAMMEASECGDCYGSPPGVATYTYRAFEFVVPLSAGDPTYVFSTGDLPYPMNDPGECTLESYPIGVRIYLYHDSFNDEISCVNLMALGVSSPNTLRAQLFDGERYIVVLSVRTADIPSPSCGASRLNVFSSAEVEHSCTPYTSIETIPSTCGTQTIQSSDAVLASGLPKGLWGHTEPGRPTYGFNSGICTFDRVARFADIYKITVSNAGEWIFDLCSLPPSRMLKLILYDGTSNLPWSSCTGYVAHTTVEGTGCHPAYDQIHASLSIGTYYLVVANHYEYTESIDYRLTARRAYGSGLVYCTPLSYFPTPIPEPEATPTPCTLGETFTDSSGKTYYCNDTHPAVCDQRDVYLEYDEVVRRGWKDYLYERPSLTLCTQCGSYKYPYCGDNSLDKASSSRHHFWQTPPGWEFGATLEFLPTGPWPDPVEPDIRRWGDSSQPRKGVDSRIWTSERWSYWTLKPVLGGRPVLVVVGKRLNTFVHARDDGGYGPCVVDGDGFCGPPFIETKTPVPTTGIIAPPTYIPATPTPPDR